MTGRVSTDVPREDRVNLAELARLRQGAYRFLGALFLYPDGERVTDLTAAAECLEAEWDALETWATWGAWQRLFLTLQGLAECGAAKLEGEYVRLFLVNPETPLYESFYIDPKRQATGWIGAQLMHEYSERGLTLSPSRGEPPDHVAVELEFMAFLCSLEARAREEEALEEASGILRRQLEFLDRHLGRWVPAFSHQVTAASRLDLYAVGVETAQAFIQDDRDLADLLLVQLQASSAVPSISAVETSVSDQI